MKKSIFIIAALLGAITFSSAQEIKVITSVESIVPMGIGRSRIIDHQTTADASSFTTSRKDGTDSNQRNVKRRDAKIAELDETKLLNFYSAVGINFQNIASNDAIISSKLTDMLAEGWELIHVTSAVESDAGETDPQGIFVTRYIFKR
ncbi:MAG: hypothetical protein HKN87_19770 [Saprospiraceae bacterium]|nr:hypothetical protein [Saprospiraceae bacterium]